MAPEQALGTAASTAWDIYAFGVILFRAATGALPFSGSNSVALAMERVRERATPLSKVVPGVNPRLEAVVSRCLEREPQRRFRQVSELQQAISMIHRPLRPMSAWRLFAIGLVLVAVLGSALGAGLHFRSEHRDAEPTCSSPSRTSSLDREDKVVSSSGATSTTASPSMLRSPLQQDDGRSRATEPIRRVSVQQENLPTRPRHIRSTRAPLGASPSSNPAPGPSDSAMEVLTTRDDDVVVPPFARLPNTEPSAGAH